MVRSKNTISLSFSYLDVLHFTVHSHKNHPNHDTFSNSILPHGDCFQYHVEHAHVGCSDVLRQIRSMISFVHFSVFSVFSFPPLIASEIELCHKCLLDTKCADYIR